MTETQISDIANGIWLCSNCHALVDDDPGRYPAALLQQWKRSAERETLRELETAEPVSTDDDASDLESCSSDGNLTIVDATLASLMVMKIRDVIVEADALPVDVLMHQFPTIMDRMSRMLGADRTATFSYPFRVWREVLYSIRNILALYGRSYFPVEGCTVVKDFCLNALHGNFPDFSSDDPDLIAEIAFGLVYEGLRYRKLQEFVQAGAAIYHRMFLRHEKQQDVPHRILHRYEELILAAEKWNYDPVMRLFLLGIKEHASIFGKDEAQEVQLQGWFDHIDMSWF
jgi:hypothetical protein